MGFRFSFEKNLHMCLFFLLLRSFIKFNLKRNEENNLNATCSNVQFHWS